MSLLPTFTKIHVAAIGASILLASFVVITARQHDTVDFNTEVKPLLNKKCITCHGGVRRQADFSLLFRSDALANTKSGKPAIIPGDPAHSEMIRRLTLKDPEDRMPYKHEPLTTEEINTLTRWIKQGAKWGDHWAYVPVKTVEVPKEKGALWGLLPAEKSTWARNDIDYFITDKQRTLSLSPSPEADKATLARRLSLDLTGLAPQGPEVQRYLQDNNPNAYETLVDSLLASPAYGERWTSMWLDLARYADTKGYERDVRREIWRYRDWLIRAFNNDKPYDQFLTEQLAGDLMPDATDEQFIATAYHRNTLTNDEGGTDNEEFRTSAVLDRVNTTWEGLLGTTFACVQCHSHPYDPFRHEEYYKFAAFFNDSRDEDTEADYPLLRHFSGDDSVQLLRVTGWLTNHHFDRQSTDVRRMLKTWQPAINSLQADSFTNCELDDTKWLAMRQPSVARLRQVNLTGKSELTYRYRCTVGGGTWTIHLDNRDGPVLCSEKNDTTKKYWEITKLHFQPVTGMHDLYVCYNNPHIHNPDTKALTFDWLHFGEPFPGEGLPGYEELDKQYWQLLSKEMPTTPVMMDNPADMHRHSYVFERGNWLVKGAEVQPDVPHSLNAFPKNAPRNRLGLAMWMTDPQNPLTARTMVNRLWEQLFGTGLAETLEDLGTQGAEPTHRELLDYLAYRFMHDDAWSIKKLLKEIVMSATYRQDSRASKEMLEKDPFNKYYARGARVRLSAEQVRDQALGISGLLSSKMYGRSVMPWQPEGMWMSPWSGEYWKRSDGEDQYRRGLYTFIKRTAPYPSMITFDGVGREVCTARRIRTNTPLQALVTLNDSVYLEAARYLAYRMQKEAGSANVDQQISKGYEIALLKPMPPAKRRALVALYRTAYEKYAADPAQTCEMAGADDAHNNPETASLVVVANALLNLDEVITKG